jgi:hypothetical protein
MFEDSSIPFVPEFPRNKHDEGGDSFPSTGVRMNNMQPPSLDVLEVVPFRRLEIMKPKPILDHGPNPPGVPTFEHKMGSRFGGAIAKQAITAIRPSTSM